MSGLSTRRLPWLRVAAEGVLIVSSILIAFGIDAAWEARADRVAETALLENLRSETHLNLVQLERRFAAHRRSEQAAIRLVRIIDGVVPLHQEPLDSLIWSTFLDSSTFEARTGVLESVVSSGSLDLVRNPSLRMMIASLGARLDDTVEEDGWIVNDVRTMWRPYLVRYSLVRPAERIYPHFRDVGPGARAYDFQRMITDPEFEGLVLLRLEDERIALEAYEELHLHAQRFMELIDLELGK